MRFARPIQTSSCLVAFPLAFAAQARTVCVSDTATPGAELDGYRLQPDGTTFTIKLVQGHVSARRSTRRSVPLRISALGRFPAAGRPYSRLRQPESRSVQHRDRRTRFAGRLFRPRDARCRCTDRRCDLHPPGRRERCRQPARRDRVVFAAAEPRRDSRDGELRTSESGNCVAEVMNDRIFKNGFE